MSGYTQFAIWGVGNLGGLIAKYLLERGGVTVIILSRPESVNKPGLQELASQGAQIRPFVVTSPEATSALKGIDVLVSTQGMTSLDLQDHILRPAVDAGVKLFVPAEFGITTDGRPEPIFAHKVHLREEAARLGLPTTAIFTGLWTEFALNVVTGDNPKVLTIKGEGDGAFSTTSMDDVARFTAYVLTSLPRDKLENAKFTLETDTLNANQVVELVQKYAPKPIEVERIARSVFEERVAKDPGDVRAVMALTFDIGRGKHPNPPSHSVYPDWRPRAVVDVLKPIIEERYR